MITKSATSSLTHTMFTPSKPSHRFFNCQIMPPSKLLKQPTTFPVKKHDYKHGQKNIEKNKHRKQRKNRCNLPHKKHRKKYKKIYTKKEYIFIIKNIE